MSVVYYRYKTTREATPHPLWSTIWPGSDGCASRNVYFASANTPTQPPSPGSPLYFEPETEIFRVREVSRSGRTNSTPPYKFTNRFVGVKKLKRFLVTRHYGCNGKQEWYQYGYVAKVGQTCTPTPTKAVALGPNYALYDEQKHDYDSYDTYETSTLPLWEVNNCIREVRNDVMEEALNSYDLLTELSQVQDIPRTLSQISGDLIQILRSLKSRHSKDVLRRARHLTPRRLIRSIDKQLRKFGGEWMNYRYGIMPLVYSYSDILKTLDRGQSTKTRKMRTVNPVSTDATLPASSATYVTKSVEGSIVVRAEVFQHFTSAEVAKLSGVGINPLVTAWELIPYSFVFDWFLDVGNYIATRTGLSWASNRQACLSIREKYSTKWAVHLPQLNNTYSVANITPTNWVGAQPPTAPSFVVQNEEGSQVFKQEDVDTYRRWTIPTTSAPPSFKPSLNWRRYIDAAVMSLTNLGRLYRALTK